MGYFPAYFGPLWCTNILAGAHSYFLVSNFFLHKGRNSYNDGGFSTYWKVDGWEVRPVLPCGNSPAIWVVRLALQGTRSFGWTAFLSLYFCAQNQLSFIVIQKCGTTRRLAGTKRHMLKGCDRVCQEKVGWVASLVPTLPHYLACLDKATLKHRKNCECCPCHSLLKGHNECWDCCSRLSEM